MYLLKILFTVLIVNFFFMVPAYSAEDLQYDFKIKIAHPSSVDTAKVNSVLRFIGKDLAKALCDSHYSKGRLEFERAVFYSPSTQMIIDIEGDVTWGFKNGKEVEKASVALAGQARSIDQLGIVKPDWMFFIFDGAALKTNEDGVDEFLLIDSTPANVRWQENDLDGQLITRIIPEAQPTMSTKVHSTPNYTYAVVALIGAGVLVYSLLGAISVLAFIRRIFAMNNISFWNTFKWVLCSNIAFVVISLLPASFKGCYTTPSLSAFFMSVFSLLGIFVAALFAMQIVHGKKPFLSSLLKGLALFAVYSYVAAVCVLLLSIPIVLFII